MVKDEKARRVGDITLMALANLMGAIVDTMQEADVPNDTIHHFLDRLQEMNELTLWGSPAKFIDGLIVVIKRTVPDND